MNKKQIVSLVLFIFIGIIYFIISGIFGVISFIIGLFLYSIIFYIIIGSYRKIKNNEYNFFDLINYKLFLDNFLYKVLILITILISLIGLFVVYQNEISPAKMPIYKLSNGEKNIIYHGMSHIGSENFYNGVKDLIKEYKNDGYVLFYEGVRPGSEENHNAFNKAIGVEFDNETYNQLSMMYGLVAQDNNMFLGLVNDNDYNVDIDMDLLMDYYNTKNISQNNSQKNNVPINITDDITSQLDNLNQKQLSVFQYINRSFINLIIKSEGLQDVIKNNFANTNLFDVILNQRDEYISNEVINSEYENIIMIYGLLHFEGIFQKLKENDPNWKIKEINHIYPLK